MPALLLEKREKQAVIAVRGRAQVGIGEEDVFHDDHYKASFAKVQGKAPKLLRFRMIRV